MTTIRDIALASGTSTATVDRVLHGRARVSERSRKAVLKAAAALGYRHGAAAGLPFDVVLPSTGGFMRSLADALLSEAAPWSGVREVRVHFVDYDAPQELAAKLVSLGERSGGVGLVALDHLLIREALKGLIARGLPVVTLLTDISSLPHQGYVGVDNRQAGRLAGQLAARLAPKAPGHVAVLTGSRVYRGHEEREMGFRSVLREAAPHLRVLDALEIGESDEAGFEAVQPLLAPAASVVAIYNIGAGTGGVARALLERDAAGRPVFIAHDLSSDTREHLLSGAIDAVIDQNAPQVAERTVERLALAAERRLSSVSVVMDSRLILRENIPQS